jgi:predicted ATP-grasp superfamily ATP-dependent carboligase
MVRIFDEADYRRRLEALESNDNISFQELGLVVEGMLKGTDFGPLDARKAINQAKIQALLQARKELIRAIRAADDKVRAGAVIPIDVQEIVAGGGDELVKVPLRVAEHHRVKLIFRYLAMQDVVDFALETLRLRSPVGGTGDLHPGLYRDSHTVFLKSAS